MKAENKSKSINGFSIRPLSKKDMEHLCGGMGRCVTIALDQEHGIDSSCPKCGHLYNNCTCKKR